MKYIFLYSLLLLTLSCSSKVDREHELFSDTTRIKDDLEQIINTPDYRNYLNIKSLNQAADYIKGQFLEVTDSVREQTFQVNGSTYKNIIASLNTDKEERIVIGAHYDVAGDQDGADDNASGVAGVLELARLLKNIPLDYRIDFVAYTLEEPPYFGTDKMGSHVHAKYLHDNNIPVKGMICLEMIGYFNDKEDSQSYPLGFLSWFYGDKGDYITVVQKFGNGEFGEQVDHYMKRASLLPTKSFQGPEWLQGVDFSDHRNYWKYGYSAVMVTNTAFYRNHNYHEPADKLETLDLHRMALVIDEVYIAVRNVR